MELECSGPNGETFSAKWNVETGSMNADWPKGAKERSEFSRDATQKALETWADVCIKALKVEGA